MKKPLLALLRRFGVQLTPYPTPDWYWQRQCLLVLFSLLQINCVLDVGAHYGEYAEFLRDIGYDGEIASYEPIMENYSRLSMRARGSRRWQVHKYGLGEHDEVKAIHVARCTDFSSFLEPNGYSNQQFGDKGQVQRDEKVEMRRLDSVFDAAVKDIANPRVFLKMDTQGWDLKVLAGASGVLDRILALQSEISVKHIYNGMMDYTDCLAAISHLGFDLASAIPVSRDENLAAIEFDCIMVRRGVTIPGHGSVGVGSQSPERT